MKISNARAAMTTPVSAYKSESPFDFSFADLLASQPLKDADLIKQLPFVPWLKEILMLRQVHALEHATVWVLSEPEHLIASSTAQLDNELIGGLSTEQGFYIYGEVNIDTLRHAVKIARRRLIAGEWHLAVHPRCGTNVSVAMLLTVGLAISSYFFLPRGPIEQVLGLSVATMAAAQLTPELGILTQRYLTTAIPFNLKIDNVIVKRDVWGREAPFVHVSWQ